MEFTHFNSNLKIDLPYETKLPKFIFTSKNSILLNDFSVYQTLLEGIYILFIKLYSSVVAIVTCSILWIFLLWPIYK